MSNNRNQSISSENAPEIQEVLVAVNRVAKVVKGGRRFSFSVLVVVGNNGKVGYGIGKALEVMTAKQKAIESAKKNMIKVPLREGRTLHHDITGIFSSGKVHLRAAPVGTGIIAGGPLRSVFECLGVQDVVAKSIGSSNPHNMVKACFDALMRVSSPKSIADKRGKKISEISARRKSALKGTDSND